ncbi:hypothetical protein [Legionella londiniensis]|uniref:Secreted protein n=1 Tax=Legionella londiniensis TaxID=45068 RepID=A0A0W0VNX8_9GAMM|nr:hypothetical protein [Legionella londiniensis]KTD21874.1 hypothetical protein Llon_1039 [Legionella londiniensis]STX92643.1 Uncharacterised protein [Legionella londiniensis]
MKLKAVLFFGFLSLFSSAFAANLHTHPQANDNSKNAATSSMNYPGYCEIEIINYSSQDVRVSGFFDDRSRLTPFIVYSGDAPHYISLYYYGYCHDGMDLYINTLRGYPVYKGYTPRGTTVYVLPVNGAPYAEVKQKS